MFHQLKNLLRKRGKSNDIDPDEIFLDSKNLPEFDTDQFEGRIEKPISRGVFSLMLIFIFLIGGIFFYKLWGLQIAEGQTFRQRSDKNSLEKTVIYADRGVIYDRNDVPIAWNTINPNSTDYSLRVYATSTGLSSTLGYIKYPTKDSNGVYWNDKFDPKDGLEKIYDSELSGVNGTKIVETDVKGNVISESVVEQPKDGKNIKLSIDIDLQRKLNSSLLDVSQRAGYKGGAGIIMDVHTGEILAASGFPEYDSQVMTDGNEGSKISSWLGDKNHPFLNRIVDGLYTPGSIMKLFVAMGVLDQGVISPTKQILSTGSISIPNPFDKTKESVFMDWRPQGYVDLRHAIAVSSNVYFYEVTGGYQDQKGIGILNIEKYTRMFGFGSTTGIYFPGELAGTIPSPDWKEKTFKGDQWRVGDTYNTAIGQYGFQVSPIQVVRALGALATKGTLVTPTFIKGEIMPKTQINLNSEFYDIVREGMRLGVTEGTSHAINFPFIDVASKTGTAQIGVSKDEVNSWVVGFWPQTNPKYAYAIVMERGSKNNQFGAVLVMQEFFDWMHIYASSYLN
jgi:penicillin-binding protein 2